MERIDTRAEFKDWLSLARKARHVSLSLLHYGSDGRNAWHSTRVRRYYPSSISFNETSVREWLEHRRVQGSTFTLTELPCLCFHDGSRVAILTDINDPTFPARTRELVRRRGVAKAIRETLGRRSQSMYAFISTSATPPQTLSASYMLRRRSSQSMGTSYYLNWKLVGEHRVSPAWFTLLKQLKKRLPRLADVKQSLPQSAA